MSRTRGGLAIGGDHLPLFAMGGGATLLALAIDLALAVVRRTTVATRLHTARG